MDPRTLFIFLDLLIAAGLLYVSWLCWFKAEEREAIRSYEERQRQGKP